MNCKLEYKYPFHLLEMKPFSYSFGINFGWGFLLFVCWYMSFLLFIASTGSWFTAVWESSKWLLVKSKIPDWDVFAFRLLLRVKASSFYWNYILVLVSSLVLSLEWIWLFFCSQYKNLFLLCFCWDWWDFFPQDSTWTDTNFPKLPLEWNKLKPVTQSQQLFLIFLEIFLLRKWSCGFRSNDCRIGFRLGFIADS